MSGAFASYKGPENLTPITGGSTLFRIDGEAQAYLDDLANRFPNEFSRALRNIGAVIRQDLATALRSGAGPKGVQWAGLSRMHIYRRMDQLKAGYADALTGRWTHGKRFKLKRRKRGAGIDGQPIPDAFNRWGRNMRRGQLRAHNPMGGRLSNAMRYIWDREAMRVQIGAVTQSAAAHLRAVQGGLRGSKGIFQFAGSQPITKSMRRAFWAAGVALKKGKTMLEQPQRPLISPVYQQRAPQLQDMIEQRIIAIFEGRTPGGRS